MLCKVPATSLQDLARSDGALICMRCALLKSSSHQVKELREMVNRLLERSSSYRPVRGQPEATFEWVGAGNMQDFHQQIESSCYYCCATGGPLQQGKKNRFHNWKCVVNVTPGETKRLQC